MSKIEIITAAPALTASPLPAPSIGENISKGLKLVTSNLVDSKVLSSNLKEFINNIQPVLDEITIPIGDFKINEIELNLVISAEGGIKMIGEFTAGIQSGITLKLSRNS